MQFYSFILRLSIAMAVFVLFFIEQVAISIEIRYISRHFYALFIFVSKSSVLCTNTHPCCVQKLICFVHNKSGENTDGNRCDPSKNWRPLGQF